MDMYIYIYIILQEWYGYRSKVMTLKFLHPLVPQPFQPSPSGKKIFNIIKSYCTIDVHSSLLLMQLESDHRYKSLLIRNIVAYGLAGRQSMIPSGKLT